MGISPTEAPAPEETVDVLGVLLAPATDPQEDLGAPVMEDAQASAEMNLQGVREPLPTRPSPGREAPDTTMEALPGTEGEGDESVGRAEEKGPRHQPLSLRDVRRVRRAWA